MLPVQHIPATWIFMTAAPPTYTQEVDRLPLRLTGRRGQDSAAELGVVAQRQMQADLSEFKVSLVYRASARTGFKATGKPCLKKQKQTNKTNKQTRTVSS